MGLEEDEGTLLVLGSPSLGLTTRAGPASRMISSSSDSSDPGVVTTQTPSVGTVHAAVQGEIASVQTYLSGPEWSPRPEPGGRKAGARRTPYATAPSLLVTGTT